MADVGRPTKMNEVTLQKLREAFMIGATDEEACLHADIATATLYNYQNEHPEFLEQKNRMKNHPKFRARRAVYNSLDDPKHAEWYLERVAKDEFSTKTEQDLSINDSDFTKLLSDLLELNKGKDDNKGESQTDSEEAIS